MNTFVKQCIQIWISRCLSKKIVIPKENCKLVNDGYIKIIKIPENDYIRFKSSDYKKQLISKLGWEKEIIEGIFSSNSYFKLFNKLWIWITPVVFFEFPFLKTHKKRKAKRRGHLDHR